jgi:hypothetical protein
MTTSQIRTQGITILCLPSVYTLLAQDIEDLLETMVSGNQMVTVLGSGIMEKQFDGCIILECSGGIPPEFLQWLRHDPDVAEFFVYERGEKKEVLQ